MRRVALFFPKFLESQKTFIVNCLQNVRTLQLDLLTIEQLTISQKLSRLLYEAHGMQNLLLWEDAKVIYIFFEINYKN